jgi:exonuclease V gamma subunit
MTVAKAQARRVIASHTTSPVALSLGGEADSSRAYGIAVAFEELFGVFIGKPTLRFLKGHALGQFHQHQNFAHWLRAANIADELGVGYLTFIKAQFWAFNAWYGRAPKPHELGSRTGKNDSAERVRQFLEAVASGTVDPERAIQSKTREVVDTTTARGRSTARTKVDPALKAQHSEAQLRSLMKNYAMSEEDIFRTFAKGANAYVYFDRKWMLDHPTYQRLRAAGEL